jgi:MFS family permease
VLTQLPSFFFTPIAGVLADRWNRHRMILICQVLAMVQAGLLSFFVFTGTVRLEIVLVLGVFIGFVNATEIPTRHAFLYSMVDRKEDLPNAIALHSFMFNFARLIGPTIAGIVIGFWGEGVCFLANSVSYIAVIIALLAMRDIPPMQKVASGKSWEHLKDGFNYTFRSSSIRTLLLLVAAMSMFGMFKAVLMPIFAKHILHGGPRTLGFLMGATGCGALTGAAYLASRKSAVKLVTIIPGVISLFGAALIVFSFSTFFWLSVVMLFLAGFGLMANMVCCSTVLQTLAQDSKRGRVMSFYTMAFMGTATIGSGLGGSLASCIGASTTILIAGLCSLFVAAVAVKPLRDIRTHIRPIPVAKIEINGSTAP